VANPDPGNCDAPNTFLIGLLLHACQCGFDGFVTGAGMPIPVLGSQVEDPRLPVCFPQPGVPSVKLSWLRLAALAVLLVHVGVPFAKLFGDASSHHTLAIAPVRESLGSEVVPEQVARDKLDRHEQAPTPAYAEDDRDATR
jgi:hypothetical protein